MRYYDLGSMFRVTVSTREVDTWNQHWPGSRLRGSYGFTFEDTGDLVDVSGFDADDVGGEWNALIEDAKEYGTAKRASKRTTTSSPSG